MARPDPDEPSRPKSDPGLPIVAPPADTPPTGAETLPGTGVNAASWGTFQRRMQMRRETTCLGAMRRAMEAGDYQAALERANELVHLDPGWNEVKLLLEQMQADATKPAETAAAASAVSASRTPVPQAAARVEDSQDVVASLPVDLTPPTAPIRATVPIAPSVRPRRHPLRALAMVAVIILAAGFGGWLAMQPADMLARWIAPLMNGRTRAQEAPAPAPDAPPISTPPQGAPPLIADLPPSDVGPAPTPASPPAKAQQPGPQAAPQQAPEAAPSARRDNRVVSDRVLAPAPQADALGTTGSTATPISTTAAKPPAATPQPSGAAAMRDAPSSVPAMPGPASSVSPPSRAPAPPPIPTLEARDVGGQPAPETVAPLPREARSPAPPAVSPASPSQVAAQQREADERAISATLGAYARAYDSLNATAVQRVWPGVDLEALGNAFEQLQSQRVAFSGCSVDIRGLHASATCRGVASYVPKVGARERTTVSREWRFGLRKVVDTWVIDSSVVR